jgi:hypothetical protein
MATSTNYGWSEPDNTSLVKDGAQAIRTLGNAIDISLWNSGYGQAGKNKLINANYSVWQRGTSFTATGYTADRWFVQPAAGQTPACSQQTFTAGAAPVAGYEGQYFFRFALSGTPSGGWWFTQRVEDVRTFAGQPVTLSFWAKATTATSSISTVIVQNFGSGGSGEVTALSGTPNLTTSWQRFSFTATFPSISGKTIGTNSYLDVRMFTGGSSINGNNIDVWGAQLEYGSTATPFQTASGGSIQGEVAMCKRYLPSVNVFTGGSATFVGYAYTTNSMIASIPFDVQARVSPTGITVNPTIAGNYTVRNKNNGDATITTLTFDVGGVSGATVLAGATLTSGDVARLICNSGISILFTGCEL